jgi:hypothetical protein
MISNRHIRSQHVAVVVSKDGTTTRTLVIETNLNPSGSDFDELVEEIVHYMKTRDILDNAEINGQARIS